MFAKHLILSFFFLLTLSAQVIGQPGTALNPEFFAANRKHLKEMLPDRSVALFFSSSEKVKSNDVNFPFHQDPDFFYLTGLNEPHALLILFKEPLELTKDTVGELIFVPGRSKDFEMWNGKRLGTVGVEDQLKIEKALVNNSFADFSLPFNHFDQILYNIPDGVLCDDPQDRGDIASMVKHFHFKTDSLDARKEHRLLKAWVAELREIKKEEELSVIRRAIEITCEAQVELMNKLDTSYTEYRAEALIEYVFRDRGAEGPGFPSIVGGGENTCILHYVENNEELSDGDLLVVDIGAEFANYSADVTRTMPVNGKFSEEQRIIYQLVLDAQKAGIQKCRKGNKFWDAHDAATAVIEQGLKKLGITKKTWEAKRYFMHGTSHYLGLDVHDAGTYQPLQVNTVMTVEPGIYIPAGADCDERWWNIGVRIEDDILVTNEGPVNLSECVPREIEEIEVIMAQ